MIVMVLAALAMTVLVPAAVAVAPEKVVVDNLVEGGACGGTVDIIESGFIVFHGHRNGKILENNTYHLDVTFTDGEKELFYRDRGRDQITATEDGIVVNVAGRTSFVNDDGYAHIGNFSWVVVWEPFSVTLVYHGGQDVDICGYFD
jgi:hypothetical protein